MKHLIRANVLWALMIIVFLVLRWEFTQGLFSQHGLYRGKNVKEWMNVPVEKGWTNVPIEYVGASRCKACHQDKFSVCGQSKHKTITCESCHGPGHLHIEKNTHMIIETSRKLCTLCHSRLISRASNFPQVDIEEHGGQSECITCHNAHGPRIGSPKIPHTLEGSSHCLLCHQVRRLKSFPKDHSGRSNETCLNCHITK